MEEKNKDVVYDATADENFEKRNSVELVRDSEDVIKEYRFRIMIKNKPDFTGSLSREEAEKLYRLYSFYGASLTQRHVNRELGNRFTLSEFKKILTAFQITKASGPFPPHMAEEYTDEELSRLYFEQKESDILKKIDQKQQEVYKQKYTEKIVELDKLKKAYLSAEYVFKSAGTTDFVIKTTHNPNGRKTIVVYLSDMHIGAYVSTEGVYDNPYDETEVNRRLGKVLQKIASYRDLDKIIIMNLGDAVDGFNARTTRSTSTHSLPQNMSNKEQGQVLIRQMSGFFKYIKENIPHNELYFYSVGHSNHGGDFEHSLVTALAISLETMGVKTHVSIRPIDHFQLDNKTIIFTHGKDNTDMFKNMPLVLNDKTELYVNEYIHTHGLSGDILVVKGDLHQSATTYGKLFKYKSVGSLFGSSNWIHANFGNTKWCCDYSIIDSQGDMVDGIIKD